MPTFFVVVPSNLVPLLGPYGRLVRSALWWRVACRGLARTTRLCGGFQGFEAKVYGLLLMMIPHTKGSVSRALCLELQLRRLWHRHLVVGKRSRSRVAHARRVGTAIRMHIELLLHVVVGSVVGSKKRGGGLVVQAVVGRGPAEALVAHVALALVVGIVGVIRVAVVVKHMRVQLGVGWIASGICHGVLRVKSRGGVGGGLGGLGVPWAGGEQRRDQWQSRERQTANWTAARDEQAWQGGGAERWVDGWVDGGAGGRLRSRAWQRRRRRGGAARTARAAKQSGRFAHRFTRRPEADVGRE